MNHTERKRKAKTSNKMHPIHIPKATICQTAITRLGSGTKSKKYSPISTTYDEFPNAILTYNRPIVSQILIELTVYSQYVIPSNTRNDEVDCILSRCDSPDGIAGNRMSQALLLHSRVASDNAKKRGLGAEGALELGAKCSGSYLTFRTNHSFHYMTQERLGTFSFFSSSFLSFPCRESGCRYSVFAAHQNLCRPAPHCFCPFNMTWS